MNISKSFTININFNGFRFNLFFGLFLVLISIVIGFFPSGLKMIWIFQQVVIMFTGILAGKCLAACWIIYSRNKEVKE